MGRSYVTYLSIDTVDQLDGLLDIAAEDGVPYLDPLSYGVDIEGFALVEVRLLSELLGSTWIAFGDEVVHNDIVDVAEQDARQQGLFGYKYATCMMVQ